MQFTMETVYDQKAMTAMARGIRKVCRRKQNRRSHLWGAFAVVLACFLMISSGEFDIRMAVTLTAVIAILLIFAFQDHLNGYIARKRGIPGLNKSLVTFHELGYHSETPMGSSDFSYDTVKAVIRTGDYFVFAFGPSHGQVYDSRTIEGGTADAFSVFIAGKIGKQVVKI